MDPSLLCPSALAAVILEFLRYLDTRGLTNKDTRLIVYISFMVFVQITTLVFIYF